MKDKKIESKELEKALNKIKSQKEEKGDIPKNNKKIVIVNGRKEFKGRSLKIEKRLFKNGQNYVYLAGTKWDDIDEFGKKNLCFSESDF
mgnify:CR=1 FL=1